MTSANGFGPTAAAAAAPAACATLAGEAPGFAPAALPAVTPAATAAAIFALSVAGGVDAATGSVWPAGRLAQPDTASAMTASAKPPRVEIGQ